ncbi:Hypothetical predicted protein [Xyrichtys novacula]|uniref:Uncharacterized protein n=1 Tax=Xyrichtys novacula TaxID=13765 RepID=A0AAV1G8Y6_XYRNO|nr:Hypothetical predicted protein [Xyrichtys novacula]
MDKRNLINTMHSYARSCLTDQLEVMDNLIAAGKEPISEQVPEVPKSKKSKKPQSDVVEDSDQRSLSILERIEKRQIETLKRLETLEDAVKEN